MSSSGVERQAIRDRGLMGGWVALVTGSSAGIGLQCAHALYTEGADVVLTARRSDLLAAACDALGDRASFLAGDITDPRHRSDLLKYVQQRHGRLDVLVNNAGACDDGPLEEQSLDDLTSVIELNLTANLDLCRLAAPMLFDSHEGSVDEPHAPPCRTVGRTRRPRQRAGTWLLSNRSHRQSRRPRLRCDCQRAYVARPYAIPR